MNCDKNRLSCEHTPTHARMHTNTNVHTHTHTLPSLKSRKRYRQKEVPGFVGVLTQTHTNTRVQLPDRARRMRMSETHTHTHKLSRRRREKPKTCGKGWLARGTTSMQRKKIKNKLRQARRTCSPLQPAARTGRDDPLSSLGFSNLRCN